VSTAALLSLTLVSGCKIEKAAFGGVTHFITTYLDAEKTQVQTIAWGQGALCGGELVAS
jgi:hypothetical protein